MRISGVAKKGVALVMTMALAVGAVAVAPSEASAAKKKAANVKVRTFYAAKTKDSACAWLYGEGDGAQQKIQTVKLTKGKKQKVTVTLTKPKTFKDGSETKKTGKIQEAVVFTVDLLDVMKSFKKVKVSGVTVTADGKKVSCKPVIGAFEKNKADSKDNWRISFYNQYGANGDNSRSKNKASKFKFDKKLQISFTVKPS